MVFEVRHRTTGSVVGWCRTERWPVEKEIATEEFRDILYSNNFSNYEFIQEQVKRNFLSARYEIDTGNRAIFVTRTDENGIRVAESEDGREGRLIPDFPVIKGFSNRDLEESEFPNRILSSLNANSFSDESGGTLLT